MTARGPRFLLRTIQLEPAYVEKPDKYLTVVDLIDTSLNPFLNKQQQHLGTGATPRSHSKLLDGTPRSLLSDRSYARSDTIRSVPGVLVL